MPHVRDYPHIIQAVAWLIVDAIPARLRTARGAQLDRLFGYELDPYTGRWAEEELAALSKDALEAAVIGDHGAVFLSPITRMLLETLWATMHDPFC